jgi:hypothetical protein
MTYFSMQAKNKCTKMKGTLNADTNVCVIKPENPDGETVSYIFFASFD